LCTCLHSPAHASLSIAHHHVPLYGAVVEMRFVAFSLLFQHCAAKVVVAPRRRRITYK